MSAQKQQVKEGQLNKDTGGLTQCPHCKGLGYVPEKIRRRE